ncbi:MAG: alpha/beta fold hydrolase [Verrucomicrobiales bacterium]|nr:alpha/beta fold hydrolase [Verrucomicrobiales bacterium]
MPPHLLPFARQGSLWLTAVFLIFVASGSSLAAESQKSPVVIIHGAFGGGWDWKNVGRSLEARGHIVYRPTLTGLGERSHLASPEISLRTHIQDVVNVIRFEGLSNVTLCAHSYAGMVATGVMEEVPQLLKRVVFLDAVLPDDGESFVAFNEAMGMNLPEKPGTGYLTLGGAFAFGKEPPSDVPQSWKTFTEPVAFRNPMSRKLPATFVFFLDRDQNPEVLIPGNDESKFRHTVWKRLTARGWKIEKFKGDHVSERSHPAELAAFLDVLLGQP